MLTKTFGNVLLLAFIVWSYPLLAQSGRGDLYPLEWRTFSVPDFGTRVQYPSSLFSVSEGEPQVGIGERFKTADGRAHLWIYSRRNESADTPATYLRHNLRYPRSAIEYQRITPAFFAISTVTDGTIYYSRCNFSGDAGGAIHCIDLLYPETEKKAWDGVVTRVSRSLRPL